MPYCHRMTGDYRPLRGDPGLKDLLSKGLGLAGSILPGPLGAAAKAGSAALRSKPQPARLPPTIAPPQATGPTRSFTGISLAGPSGIRVGRETTTTTGFYASGLPVSQAEAAAGGGCPKGFRLNRTGYHLLSGAYVAPYSKCVRIRRKQMANTKALRGAIGRTRGFVKLVQRSRKGLRQLSRL